MGFYALLDGISRSLRMKAVKETEVDAEFGEVEVITPVIRLAGTEAENGLVDLLMTTVTGSYTIPAGARSVFVYNLGDVEAPIANGSLLPGIGVGADAPVGAKLKAIVVGGPGTTLMISEVR